MSDSLILFKMSLDCETWGLLIHFISLKVVEEVVRKGVDWED